MKELASCVSFVRDMATLFISVTRLWKDQLKKDWSLYSRKNCALAVLRLVINSKGCTSRSVCEKCERYHPTCLHQDRVYKGPGQRPRLNQDQSRSNQDFADRTTESQRIQESMPVTSNRVVQEKNGTYTSSIVPVYVSTIAEPRKEI